MLLPFLSLDTKSREQVWTAMLPCMFAGAGQPFGGQEQVKAEPSRSVDAG